PVGSNRNGTDRAGARQTFPTPVRQVRPHDVVRPQRHVDLDENPPPTRSASAVVIVKRPANETPNGPLHVRVAGSSAGVVRSWLGAPGTKAPAAWRGSACCSPTLEKRDDDRLALKGLNASGAHHATRGRVRVFEFAGLAWPDSGDSMRCRSTLLGFLLSLRRSTPPSRPPRRG